MIFSAAQAQMKIKILEKVKNSAISYEQLIDMNIKLPDLQPPEQEETEQFKYASILSRYTHVLIWNKGSLRPKRSHLRYCKCQK
jgi:hypothetical protein